MSTNQPSLIDIEIDVADIQSINSADALAAFFARLGYNTDARHKQTPANLGITAEGTIRPIKKIELLAEQGGLLHVYLFELSSVTTSHTRALVRAFRNRAGNYLLILTSDYEEIDFVLVDKYVPPDTQGPAPKQVGVRPRAITVGRRKPGRIHLRVLRRFTYTESDPFKQYDKLLSAYTIADWSEEFFNNKALFSDYYLLNRLQEHPVWKEDPKPAFKALREIFYEARSIWAGKSEAELRKGLLEPIFSTLGFKAVAVKSPKASDTQPDYKLYGLNGDGQPLVVCLTYPWERSMDGKDDVRDKDTPDENPGAVVVSLLERKESPWAIVTNGKIWRLYSTKSHSRATNYYEMDLDEILAQGGLQTSEPAESFRYFWLLFRRQAFESVEFPHKGETRTAPFLDHLLSESYDYAKELGERLKGRVFEEVFPQLASGFIEHLRQKEGEETDLHQEVLDQIFQGTLTLLYRLLFVLYAEARDLLPVREARGYWEISLTRLKNEIANGAGAILDETENNLKKHYKTDSCELYNRLLKLFQVIDKGNPDFNVPVYNGGLFLSEPEDNDLTPEAENARFLIEHKVPGLFLAHGIDLIARDLDAKRLDLVFIDYKSLGVRQLGSIYEGLLEFKLRVAKEKMAIVKGKKTEEIVPYKEAKSSKDLRILTEGRGNNAKERTIPKGALYLESDKRERRATGSYYTPDYIVEYIVENAVGPVLKEKFEAIALKFREAQKDYREAVQRNKTLLQKGMRGDSPEKVADTYKHLVDELFDVKVLDPAMGSGHFVVEAVDFITDKMLDFLNGFPWNPVFAQLQNTRDTILREMEAQGITIDPSRLTQVNLLKRYVLKRCIYGVDLNPMAVELAKVSLWLDCFTLGAPLSFLDHHLKCGNSLLGTTVEQVREEVEEYGYLPFLEGRFTRLLLATDLMRKVGELSDITSAQVSKSRMEYRKALDALAPAKRILDIYTSQWFGNKPQTEGRGKKRSNFKPVVALLRGEHAEKLDREEKLESLPEREKQIVHRALEASKEKRFFHWELEYPEVFYGPQEGTERVIKKKENPGFDAVVGNPPWGADLTKDETFYFKVHFPTVQKGVIDTFALFIEEGYRILKTSKHFCLLLPDIVLLKNYPTTRKFLLENTSLVEIVHWGMPFTDVNLDVCSILWNKMKASVDRIVSCVTDLTTISVESGTRRNIRQLSFSEQEGHRFNVYLDLELDQRIKAAKKLGPPFGELFEIHEGIHSGNIREKLFPMTRVSPKCEPLIFGRDEVRPFTIKWNGRFVNYNPGIVDHSKGEYANLGNCSDYKQTKILVRRTGDKVIAALDKEGFFVSNNLFYCIPLEDMGDDVYYVLAILNSQFATWFFRSIQPRKDRLFAELKINHLKQIPIPCMDNKYKEFRKCVANLVKKQILKETATGKVSHESVAQLENLLISKFQW